MRQLGIVPAGYHSNVSGCISDGQQYFAYCSNLAIYIVDVATCRLRHIIAGYESTISCIDWNPFDSSQIVAASKDKTVQIWHITAEASINTLKLETVPTIAMWNLLDPSFIAIATEDTSVRIWDVKSESKPVGAPIRDFSHSPVKKLRWSPRLESLLAGGHDDCSITVFNTASGRGKKFKCRDKELGGHTGGVLDLQWDPLSDNYLLASFGGGTMALFDTDSQTMVRLFDKQAGGGIGCLEWIKGSPGSFLAASERHGSVRRWNVSQSHSEAAFKVGNTGLKTLRLLPGDHRFLSAAMDGTVGIYNMRLKRWDHEVMSGHCETIFACEFQATDRDVLATGSYDGTIKLWNVARMEAIDTLKPNSGVIYSIAWPHEQGDVRVACSTSDGKVVIMNAFGPKKGAIAATFEQPLGFVYKVSWSKIQPQVLACATQSGDCWVFSSDGGKTFRVKLKHPGACFGCDFSPRVDQQSGAELLATACEDAVIRVYDVCVPDAPVLLHTLVGHTDKVFGVSWNPILPSVLASASDDYTVRVFDINSPGGQIILQGHTHKVRALSWHHEFQHLLFSGSWDGCIRVWDVRGAGTCIRLILDHHADVYGIASHPGRPFFFASSSRDITLRFWRADVLTPDTTMRCVISRDWEKDKIVGKWEDCPVPSTRVMMCGTRSKEVSKEVSLAKDDKARAAIIAKFICHPDGLEEVVSLAAAQGSKVPEITNMRVVHGGSLFNVKLNEAFELERARSKGFGGIGKQTKEEALLKAASIYAKLGYMRQYCDIMAELGDWPKALSLAPVVSMEYWKQMAEKRARILASEDDFSCVPLLVASGRAYEASDFLTVHGALEDAFCIAQVAYEAGYEKIESSLGAKPQNGALTSASTLPLPHSLNSSTASPATSLNGGGGGGGGGSMLGMNGAGAAPGTPHARGKLEPLETLLTRQNGASSPEAGITIAGNSSPGHASSIEESRSRRRDECAARVRREYTLAGRPLLAASASLSVDDADRGLRNLVLGCELELAMLLLPVLKEVQASTRDDVLLRASTRCEKLGLYQEALCCLEKLSDDEMRLASAGQMYARLTQMGLIEAAEMSSLAETVLQLAGIKGKPEDIPTPTDSLPAIEAIATHALRKEYSDAIEKGLASLKLLVEGSGREGSLPSEIIKDGKMICRWLGSISITVFSEDQRLLIMAYDSYLGGLNAIDKGFATVVSPLFNFARDRSSRVTNPEIQFPIHKDDLTLIHGRYHAKLGTMHHSLSAQIEAIIAETDPATAGDDAKRRVDECKSILSGQLTSVSGAPSAVDEQATQVYPAGWTIPSAACRRAGVRCFMSGRHIQGPEVWLSQLTPNAPAAAISLADAAMWDAVCVFSPIGDGQLMGPT